jgi:hypothetical protein
MWIANVDFALEDVDRKDGDLGRSPMKHNKEGALSAEIG